MQVFLGLDLQLVHWCGAGDAVTCRKADPTRAAMAEVKFLLLWMTCEIRRNRRPLWRLEKGRKSGDSNCKVSGGLSGSNLTVML